jgi:hypothetical protein
MSRCLTHAVLAVAAVAVTHVAAWPQFLGMIPNGRAVDFGVVNLGHEQGTILRHQFGRDFGVGRNWTKELCEMDSDKDGQTNGQELGDPCCVWSIGRDDLLSWTNGTSNPGNATSLSDASLWKKIDCAAVQKSAAAKKDAADASKPAAKSGAASVTVAGVTAVAAASALVLW